ncbi:MAG: SelB C-terminal domain-containing protein, partial [Croceibacterium sp.]
TAVRVHHGAAEVAARVAVLQDDPLAAGQDCPVQLVLDQPIAAAAMDRFVIRSADGARTIGGGYLIDLNPPQRRRKQVPRLAQLAAMAEPDPARSLALQLDRWPWFVDRARFQRDRALGPGQMAAVLAATDHVASGTHLFGPRAWQSLAASALAEVALFHKRFPQLLGPNLQRLVTALDPRLPKGPAQAVLERLVATAELAREAGVYRLPGHRLGLDRADDVLWRAVQPLLAGEHRFRPQRVAGLAEAIRTRDFDLRRVLKAMSKQGKVIEVAPDHFFLRETMVEVAVISGELAQAAEQGLFGAAALRDRLEAHGQGVGRKVAIQLLEYFDRQGMTLRREDLRLVDPRRLAAFVSGAAD